MRAGPDGGPDPGPSPGPGGDGTEPPWRRPVPEPGIGPV